MRKKKANAKQGVLPPLHTKLTRAYIEKFRKAEEKKRKEWVAQLRLQQGHDWLEIHLGLKMTADFLFDALDEADKYLENLKPRHKRRLDKLIKRFLGH